jgi:hypothetical protein
MSSNSVSVTRRHLAFVVVILVSFVAAASIPVPGALVVFDKLLPVLMLVLGYYFGESGSSR